MFLPMEFVLAAKRPRWIDRRRSLGTAPAEHPDSRSQSLHQPATRPHSRLHSARAPKSSAPNSTAIAFRSTSRKLKPISTSKSNFRFRLRPARYGSTSRTTSASATTTRCPNSARTSSALHILSESWNARTPNSHSSLAGIPGHHYVLNIWNPSQIASVDGAQFKPAFGLSGDEGAGQSQCSAHAPERDCGCYASISQPYPNASTTGFVTRSLVVRFQSSK